MERGSYINFLSGRLQSLGLNSTTVHMHARTCAHEHVQSIYLYIYKEIPVI